MKLEGSMLVASLARALRHTPRRMHELLRHGRCPVHGPKNKPYVWLADLDLHMPAAMRTLRMLKGDE